MPQPAGRAPASRLRVSPAARKRAAELGLDLSTLSGSGPHGVLTLADIEAAARPAAPSNRQAAMRQSIAAAMSRSKREIPHYYRTETIALGQDGLIAPTLHDVVDKPLAQLMDELSDLVRRARSGSLCSPELSDAGLTVTQLGDQGVDCVFGVFYPPQVALAGFGRILERAWVEDGQLCVRPTVVASLAADHRFSNGHYGARLLGELGRLLQAPANL